MNDDEDIALTPDELAEMREQSRILAFQQWQQRLRTTAPKVARVVRRMAKLLDAETVDVRAAALAMMTDHPDNHIVHDAAFATMFHSLSRAVKVHHSPPMKAGRKVRQAASDGGKTTAKVTGSGDRERTRRTLEAVAGCNPGLPATATRRRVALTLGISLRTVHRHLREIE